MEIPAAIRHTLSTLGISTRLGRNWLEACTTDRPSLEYPQATVLVMRVRRLGNGFHLSFRQQISNVQSSMSANLYEHDFGVFLLL